jgi:hypothetical protein
MLHGKVGLELELCQGALVVAHNTGSTSQTDTSMVFGPFQLELSHGGKHASSNI